MISVLCVVKMLNPTCCVKLIIIEISDEDFRAGSTWVCGPESIWYAWLALTPITISKMFYLSQVLGRRPALKIHGLRTAFIISAAGRTFLRPWEYLRQVEQRSAADYLSHAACSPLLPARKLLKLKHKQPKLLTRNDPGCNSCLFKVLC